MTVRGQLLQMLQAVAEALGEELRSRLVFVGGCTTALFITDPITLEGVRATDDVDLIVDLAGYAAWAKLQEQLREKGFAEAQGEEVICRMRLGALKVDFMPDDAAILGFSNRWYAKGIETAVICPLDGGLSIRRLTPELFIATKLEAHLGRGKDDLFMSRDLEDILLVIDGRPEIVAEIEACDEDVRQFIAGQFAALLRNRDFDYFLEGSIRGPEGRVDIVRRRFAAIGRGASDGHRRQLAQPGRNEDQRQPRSWGRRYRGP
jgi:predicted nucleotidyltransferase